MYYGPSPSQLWSPYQNLPFGIPVVWPLTILFWALSCLSCDFWSTFYQLLYPYFAEKSAWIDVPNTEVSIRCKLNGYTLSSHGEISVVHQLWVGSWCIELVCKNSRHFVVCLSVRTLHTNTVSTLCIATLKYNHSHNHNHSSIYGFINPVLMFSSSRKRQALVFI